MSTCVSCLQPTATYRSALSVSAAHPRTLSDSSDLHRPTNVSTPKSVVPVQPARFRYCSESNRRLLCPKASSTWSVTPVQSDRSSSISAMLASTSSPVSVGMVPDRNNRCSDVQRVSDAMAASPMPQHLLRSSSRRLRRQIELLAGSSKLRMAASDRPVCVCVCVCVCCDE